MMISRRSISECSGSSKIRARGSANTLIASSKEHRALPYLLRLSWNPIQIEETSSGNIITVFVPISPTRRGSALAGLKASLRNLLSSGF